MRKLNQDSNQCGTMSVAALVDSSCHQFVEERSKRKLGSGEQVAPMNKQRTVANVRERKRTQQLNQAFKQLQAIIPKEPSDKMSKIHTLKLAKDYIRFLSDILDSEPAADSERQEQKFAPNERQQQSQPVASPRLSAPDSCFVYSPCSSNHSTQLAASSAGKLCANLHASAAGRALHEPQLHEPQLLDQQGPCSKRARVLGPYDFQDKPETHQQGFGQTTYPSQTTVAPTEQWHTNFQLGQHLRSLENDQFAAGRDQLLSGTTTVPIRQTKTEQTNFNPKPDYQQQVPVISELASPLSGSSLSPTSSLVSLSSTTHPLNNSTFNSDIYFSTSHSAIVHNPFMRDPISTGDLREAFREYRAVKRKRVESA